MPRPDRRAAQRLLEHEAAHLGKFGNHRILFTALGDTDDPRIAAGLRRAYRAFFRWICGRVQAARAAGGSRRAVGPPDDDATAWAILDLGTIATLAKEPGLASARGRPGLVASAGRWLVAAGGASTGSEGLGKARPGRARGGKT